MGNLSHTFLIASSLSVVEGVAIVQQRSLGGGLHARLHARLHGGHGGHGIGQVLGQRHVLGLEVVQEVLRELALGEGLCGLCDGEGVLCEG
jgi:hypothetical protein